MAHHKRLGRGTPCKECDKPILDKENEEAWEIFSAHFFQSRVGGLGTWQALDFNAMTVVMDARGIPKHLQNWILEKLSVIGQVAFVQWNKSKKDGKP